MNATFWKNKKIFLTGHTGFKGSWASLWLLKAGANVTGYSLGLPTTPSLFQDLKIENDMNSIFSDVRDFEKLKSAMIQSNPDIVIHMAAQPLVRYSYLNPVETYMTNVMGVVHLFESVRACTNVKTVINVTSDKCYENQERLQGYAEHEPMGGFDPYSNSKGCSELVTSSYRNSFFSKSGVGLASGRAGNVIGGGDWAGDRLVPDMIRSVLENRTLEIRNPKSTRPWQHVLEPVGGYLHLAEKLFADGNKYAEGYNFGPSTDDHCDVETVIQIMNKHWNNKIKYNIHKSENNPHEAHYLSLDCSKAKNKLGWQPKWTIDQALQKTVEWVEAYQNQQNIREFCLGQIGQYEHE